MSEPLINRDLEEAAVGAALLHPPLLRGDMRALRPEHFNFIDLAKLWRAMQEMCDAGDNVDVISLSAKVPDFPLDGLASMLARANSTSGPTYARQVIDLGTRRRLFEIARVIAQDVTSADAVSAMRRAHDAIENIGQGSAQLATTASAVAAGVRADISAGSIPLLYSPWREVNRLIGGLVVPELAIIAARPSMGKTMFALQWADFVARKGRHVLFHVLEGDAASLVRRRGIFRAKVDWMRFRRGLATQGEKDSLAAELEAIEGEGAIFHIIDRPMSVEEFAWEAAALDARFPLEMIVCDYLQRYRTDGRDSVREMGAVAEGLKDIASELHVPLVVTSQLRRLDTNRRPQMEDLRESGILEQTADIVVGLYREAYYNPTGGDDSGDTEILIMKARDGVRGVASTLYWNAPHLSFESKGAP